MSTQKALVIFEAKQAWKLVNDWPVLTPGPREVLVKIMSAALNPVEHFIQTVANFPFIQYPYIGGCDGAGIVEEVGAEVTSLVKGDKILFPGGFETHLATFKQYSVIPADNAAKIPENISFDQAASVPLCLGTAATGMWVHDSPKTSLGLPAPWEEDANKYAGQAAFIVGGSSSVGQYVIQLARMSGFSPIITTASPGNDDFLKSLGATHVVDRTRTSADILAALPALTGGKPIVFAYDAIARDKSTQHLAYDALADGGGLVVTKPQSHELLADRVREGDGKRVARPFASLQTPENKTLGVELYKRLTEWLRTGVLVPNRTEVVPNGLLGIPVGLDMIRNGRISGKKLIVHPQETL